MVSPDLHWSRSKHSFRDALSLWCVPMLSFFLMYLKNCYMPHRVQRRAILPSSSRVEHVLSICQTVGQASNGGSLVQLSSWASNLTCSHLLTNCWAAVHSTPVLRLPGSRFLLLVTNAGSTLMRVQSPPRVALPSSSLGKL